jgi:NAD(P)-dependent dehydrogenase (short-subunit alcohol dehydrogenase family)
MTLTDQRVVVIGGSSGMGLATAQAAARDGAAVTVVSSRPERVDAAIAELPAGSDGAALDVRDEDAVTRLFEQMGELDHLVFTAGDSFTPRPLTEMSPAEAHAVLEVRFWGAVGVIRSAAPRIRTGGSIALTTGTVGQRPVPGAALAAAGAGAAEGLVRGLAVELSPVRVNAVRAGAIRTPLWDGVPEAQREALFARMSQRTLLGTIGEPEQIARAHLYLMQNGYVTGTVLTVDGGLLLAG